jgi:hypothetical protein
MADRHEKSPCPSGEGDRARMGPYLELKTIMSQQTEPDKTLDDLFKQLSEINRELERSNDKFDTYQKATQWVVQLSFSLILSATVITIASAIFKR